jgi:hypothetical protein
MPDETRRQALALSAGAVAMTIAKPGRLAGYTVGERDVIRYCEQRVGRQLTEREIAFQLGWAETVLGPRCQG